MHSHAAEAEAALVTSLRAGDEGGFVQVVDLQAPRRHASHATTSGHQIAEGPLQEGLLHKGIGSSQDQSPRFTELSANFHRRKGRSPLTTRNWTRSRSNEAILGNFSSNTGEHGRRRAGRSCTT